MARGWESKGVEEQISEAQEKPKHAAAPATPEEAERRRRRQTLELSRARILAQLRESQDPRLTEMLQRALADLDSRLAASK